MTETDKKIAYIAEHYGYENQSRQCVEEMAELTQAICKYERVKGYPEKRVAKEHIQEELADVEIMVRQLKVLLGKERVEEEIGRKLNRQLKRIGEETMQHMIE